MKFLKIKLRKVDVSETIDEGVYQSKVAKVEKVSRVFDGNTVPRLKISFRITDKKFAGRMLSYQTGIEATPKNKLGKLLKTLIPNKIDFDEEIELDSNDLVGAKCKIIVKHSEQLKDDGTPWENISDILKSNGKGEDLEEDSDDEEEEDEKSSKKKKEDDGEDEDEESEEEEENVSDIQKKFDKLDEETQDKIMNIIKKLKAGDKVPQEKIALAYKKMKLDIDDFEKPKKELCSIKKTNHTEEVDVDEL